MNEQKTGSEEPSKTAPGAIKNAARVIAGLGTAALGTTIGAVFTVDATADASKRNLSKKGQIIGGLAAAATIYTGLSSVKRGAIGARDKYRENKNKHSVNQ